MQYIIILIIDLTISLPANGVAYRIFVDLDLIYY